MSRLSQTLNSFGKCYSSMSEQNIVVRHAKIKEYYSTMQNATDLSDSSIIEFEKINDSHYNTTFPPSILFGNQDIDLDGSRNNTIKVPLLLPVESQNAIFFDVQDVLKKEVTVLFQKIAIRTMLHMDPSLCKYHFVDANFGGNYGSLTRIKNKKIQTTSYNSITEVQTLITELSRIIVEANQTYLTQCSNLSEYNTKEPKLAKPYHLVFLDDFPSCFNANTLADLRKFIIRGNASKAGVFFFINYSKECADETGLSDDHYFDVNGFKRICTCFEAASDKRVTINGKPSVHFVEGEDVHLDSGDAGHNVMVRLMKLIENKEPYKTDISLDNWIKELIENDEVWKSSSMNGINVPVGFSISNPGDIFNYYIANDNDSNCRDYFSLVAGNPGYGKTTLLHDIILNACMKYSPEDLELYLVDFANGASFSIYKNLPHAKALMLANNREYALRILAAMEKEAERRANLYTKVLEDSGKMIEKLSEYRQFTGKQLPRILIVMDEFHHLFSSTNPTIFEAREKLINGIRDWRKYGISIILSTQSISGVNFGDANDYITYRFAFNLTGENSMAVIRNREATHLTEKGQCLMNNATDGDVRKNIEFRCALTRRKEEYVAYLADKYQQSHEGQMPHPYVCTSIPYADILSNTVFANKELKTDKYRCYTYLGQPDLLRRSHTRLCYQRRDGSNTIILGTDYPTIVNTIALSLFQAKIQLSQGSRFYIVDCTNPGDEYEHAFDELPSLCDGIKVCGVEMIEELNSTLISRKKELEQGVYNPESVFVVFFNIQSASRLKADTSNGYPQPSQLMNKLLPIIKDGPALGIHNIVHAENSRVLFSRDGLFGGDGILSRFDNKILLKGTDIDTVLIQENVKVSNVEKESTMLVFNRRLDGERYEQCKAYATLGREKLTLEKISIFFKDLE